MSAQLKIHFLYYNELFRLRIIKIMMLKQSFSIASLDIIHLNYVDGFHRIQ